MRKLLLMLPLAFLTLGCEKNTSKRCEELKVAVQNDDVGRVKDIINRLAADLGAGMATATDPDGYYNSYHTLIDRLNDECEVNATGICYACIYTFPGTSEIKLEIFLGTHSVTRVIDVGY
ncbi:MAG: hypothetical protein ACTHMV_13100 [Chitinophagaceae bacterium]